MRSILLSLAVLKNSILPGLLGGIVLLWLQILIIFLLAKPIPGRGPVPGFPFLPGSTAVIPGLALLAYFVIPMLLAFLVTSWTHQPAAAYRAGRIAGMLCTIILIIITVNYQIPQPALSPENAPHHYYLLGSPGPGIIYNYLLSILCQVAGSLLAILGAFLGSKIWRRTPSPQVTPPSERS